MSVVERTMTGGRTRRKQSKPQRMAETELKPDNDTVARCLPNVAQLTSSENIFDKHEPLLTSWRGDASAPVDCHVCGLCAKEYGTLEQFTVHKHQCSSATNGFTADVALPSVVDLSVTSARRQRLEDDANYGSAKRNGRIETSSSSADAKFHQYNQCDELELIKLYSQYRATVSNNCREHQEENEIAKTDEPLFPSPPSSHDENSTLPCHGVTYVCHNCSDDAPVKRFTSEGAWLWHRISEHPVEFSLRCNSCEQQFHDPHEAYIHAKKTDCSDELDIRSKSVDGFEEKASERQVSALSAPPPITNQYQIQTLAASAERNNSVRGQKPTTKLNVHQIGDNDMPLDLSRSMTKSFANSVSFAEGNIPTSVSSDPNNHLKQNLSALLKLQYERRKAHGNFGEHHDGMNCSGDSGTEPTDNYEVLPDVDDADWEKYMELNQVDENEKIRKLVGDKSTPVTDPNQCLICRRVLSCKSALQMHYRTHTGDRPFKCRICQRAFTTKGNLKTHMGVHRVKHLTGAGGTSSAMLHQCPICQQRFFNTFQLQQHVAAHTSQLMQHNGLSNSNAVVVDVCSTTHGSGSFDPLPTTVQNSTAPLNLAQLTPPSSVPQEWTPPSLPFAFPPFMLPPQTTTPLETAAAPAASTTPTAATTTCNVCCRTFACNSALEIHYRSHTKDRPFKCSVCHRGFSTKGNMKQHLLTHKAEDVSNADSINDAQMQLEVQHHAADSQQTDGCELTNDENQDTMSNASTPKLSVDMSKSSDGSTPCALAANHDRAAQTPYGRPPSPSPLESIQKMWAQTEPPTRRRTPVLSKHQCGVCFKHFSSSSALQIHMRTHTGDKPFRCAACGRAFTTKGNLKVHMGTHVWQHSPQRRGRRIFDFATGGGHANGAGGRASVSPPSDEATYNVAAQMTTKMTEQSSARALHVFGSELSSPSGFMLPGQLQHMVNPFPMGASPYTMQNGLFTTAPSSIPTTKTPSAVEQMMWMWRTVCSVCQKVFPSSGQLEEHLKLHLNGHINGEKDIL